MAASRWLAAGALASLLAAGCGGAGAGVRSAPAASASSLGGPGQPGVVDDALEAVWQRAATAGDPLLARLPPGAEIVVEIDLARGREHPLLGESVRALLAAAAGAPWPVPSELTGQGAVDPLARAGALVMASYRVGTAEAESLTLLSWPPTAGSSAQQAAAALGATALDAGALALGPPALIARVAAQPAASPPADWRRLRARAMPAGATGALVRVTAALSFEAQVALARQTGLDPPPARLSLWADAIDDAALVLWADSAELADPRAGARLAAALRGAVAELAAERRVAALGLAAPLREAALTQDHGRVRLVAIVPPARLRRVAARAKGWLSAPSAPLSSVQGAPP